MDFKAIIDKSRDFIEEYWFENLNLRGGYKKTILDYIAQKYPSLKSKYEKIYLKGDKSYWMDLALEIKAYCETKGLAYINYFYHEELVKEKLLKIKRSRAL